MVGEGFEPSKAKPTDLQSVPFDRSGTPPIRIHQLSLRACRSTAKAGKYIRILTKHNGNMT